MQTPNSNILQASELGTPIGDMLVICDDAYLYMLEFTDHPLFKSKITCLQIQTKLKIIAGATKQTALLKYELSLYFVGGLQKFSIPLFIFGTPFQKMTWEGLLKIPYGTTKSYMELAKAINKPSAYRAVANANGDNRISIVIPCHRVIKIDGSLGGYGGGVTRKQWLLNHEKNI